MVSLLTGIIQIIKKQGIEDANKKSEKSRETTKELRVNCASNAVGVIYQFSSPRVYHVL